MASGGGGIKIAFVYDAIYPYSMGGGEKRIFEIGRRLVSMGHDVHLYGMKYWRGPAVIESHGMTLHGICPAVPLYTRDGRRRIAQAVLFGLACARLSLESFDVIDCAGFPYFSLVPARLAAWRNRVPLFATWHEVWGAAYWRTYLGRLGCVGAAIERACARVPTTTVSVSRLTTLRLTDMLGLEASVLELPNGVDVARFGSVPKATEVCDAVFAGRLLRHKRVDLLLEAVAVARVAVPNFSLTIIGDGPERADLERLCTSLELDEAVRFLGFVGEDDVIASIKSAKVMVLPSEREGFGIVVLEANACGVPALVTNHADNAAGALIEEGLNGWLVEHTVPALASALVDVATARSHAAGPAEVAKHYDWDRIAERAEEIYALRPSSDLRVG